MSRRYTSLTRVGVSRDGSGLRPGWLHERSNLPGQMRKTAGPFVFFVAIFLDALGAVKIFEHATWAEQMLQAARGLPFVSQLLQVNGWVLLLSGLALLGVYLAWPLIARKLNLQGAHDAGGPSNTQDASHGGVAVQNSPGAQVTVHPTPLGMYAISTPGSFGIKINNVRTSEGMGLLHAPDAGNIDVSNSGPIPRYISFSGHIARFEMVTPEEVFKNHSLIEGLLPLYATLFQLQTGRDRNRAHGWNFIAKDMDGKEHPFTLLDVAFGLPKSWPTVSFVRLKDVDNVLLEANRLHNVLVYLKSPLSKARLNRDSFEVRFFDHENIDISIGMDPAKNV